MKTVTVRTADRNIHSQRSQRRVKNSTSASRARLPLPPRGLSSGPRSPSGAGPLPKHSLLGQRRGKPAIKQADIFQVIFVLSVLTLAHDIRLGDKTLKKCRREEVFNI